MVFAFNFVYLVALPDNPHVLYIYLFFVIHGAASSMFMSSYWPCVKLIIPSNLTTTAYGLAYCMQNLLLVIGPAVAGIIIDRTELTSGGYLWCAVFLFGLSVGTAIVGLIVLLWDYNGSAVLYRGIPESDMERTVDNTTA